MAVYTKRAIGFIADRAEKVKVIYTKEKNCTAVKYLLEATTYNKGKLGSARSQKIAK